MLGIGMQGLELSTEHGGQAPEHYIPNPLYAGRESMAIWRRRSRGSEGSALTAIYLLCDFALAWATFWVSRNTYWKS